MKDVLGFILCALLFVGAVWLVILNEKHWEKFSSEHHCTVVSETMPQTIWVTGSDGNLHTATTSGSKTYSCDAGALTVTR